MKLQQDGIIMNHKKVYRIMKQEGLVTKLRRRNPYKHIHKKGDEHRTAPNLLDRQFDVSQPATVLCTDITYLKFFSSFVYLSVVKDIGSGEVVAWYLDRSLHLPLVLKTLEQLDQQVYGNALIHSDQGWHYTHPRYIAMVQNRGMVQSMSRKGNCIDNAPIESFFGHFKDEIDISSCRSFQELCLCIDEYMEHYNHKRPQWNNNKMTPIQYRSHMLSW
jgi:transposase InsO family protein